MNIRLKIFLGLNILIIAIILSGCASFTSKDNSGIIIGKPDKVNGILIHEVQKGSPVERAGIRNGDIVVSYDGKQITDMENLKKEIEEAPAGKEVILEVMRGNSLFNTGITFKKKGWQIINVDPTNEFPNYAINLIEDLLWIGSFPYPVELKQEERMLLPYDVFDPDHLPENPPTFFMITVR